MKEFVALRLCARQRRDKAIAYAKSEYASSLRQLTELEQRLLGRTDPRHMKLSAAVEHVIPINEQFTFGDVIASLEGLDPGRVWNRTSVESHLTKLRRRGLVRRVRRHKVGEPAIYMRCQGEAEPEVSRKTVRQIILEVVKQPMRTAEIVVAVVESGFQTRMDPTSLRTHVVRILREIGFRDEGGRWVPPA